MEAHLAPTQPTEVSKITTSCKICSSPHETQYCMEDPKQDFVEYASSRTDEAGDENPIRNLGDYSKPSHEGYMNTIELPVGNNVEGPQNFAMTSRCSNNIMENLYLKHGLISKTYYKSPSLWHRTLAPSPNCFYDHALVEDLALYDNESWNNQRNFTKPVKAIALPQDFPSTSFVEYASSRTDEAGGKWYTFKPEQNNLDDTYNPS
nr:hypothetical protein [Tanacetum cinerariifolium]